MSGRSLIVCLDPGQSPSVPALASGVPGPVTRPVPSPVSGPHLPPSPVPRSRSLSAPAVGSECRLDEQQCLGYHIPPASGRHGVSCPVSHGCRGTPLDRAAFGLLIARYIPGRKSILLDQLSRPDQILPTEWPLLLGVFKEICEVFGRPHLDLFATRRQCQASSVHVSSSGPDSVLAGRVPAPLGPSVSLFLLSICSAQAGIVESSAFVGSGGPRRSGIYQETFFLEKGLKFFFHINMKKMKNQARNEIFRQMTMTLTLIQNIIYVQWMRKGCLSKLHLREWSADGYNQRLQL